MSRTTTACGVAVLCFASYVSNMRVMGQWDSVPARLLPFSLLRDGDIDMREFTWLTADGLPYFLRRTEDQRLVSAYPIATPLLVTPLYIPAAWWAAHSQVDLDDTRFRVVAIVMERIGAATLAAISVALVFLAACALTSEAAATAVALLYGLGTSVWCVSSQALWQHAPAQMALAGVSLCLLRPPTRLNTLGASAFAALAVAVRPMLLVFAAAAALVVLRERRRDLAGVLGFFAIGAVAGGLLVAYNLRVFGAVGGGYVAGAEAGAIGLPSAATFAALWVSPNRGLLVYTPLALLAFAHPFLRRRGQSVWLDLALFVTIAYSAIYACSRYWWAGYTYGPRYMIDPLPVLALAAIPAAELLWRRLPGRALVAALAAWCLGVQVIGVYLDANGWNDSPTSVNFAPERLWDWGDLQIVREAREPWHGSEIVPILRQAMDGASPPAYLRPLQQQLASEIALVAPLAPIHAGRAVGVLFDLTNRSGATWPALGDWGLFHVLAVYRWVGLDEDNADTGPWRALAGLQVNLPTDSTVRVHRAIAAPARPGRYRLEIAASQGSFHNAFDPGPPGLSQEFDVSP